MVPGLDVRHALTDVLDDARALVAEDRREPAGDGAVLRGYIRVTDPARHELDANLAGLQVHEPDVVPNLERLVQLEENRCFHLEHSQRVLD